MSEYVSEYILTRNMIKELAEKFAIYLVSLANAKLLLIRKRYVERLSPKLLAYILIKNVLDKAIDKLEEILQISADEIMLAKNIDIFA